MFKGKKEKISIKNLLISIILFFVFFAIMVSLISANIRIKQRRAEIASKTEIIKKEIETLEKITEELENNIEGLGDDYYLEKVAREKLGLKLEGEEVIYITREDRGELEEEKGTGENKEIKNKGWIEKIKDIWSYFSGN